MRTIAFISLIIAAFVMTTPARAADTFASLLEAGAQREQDEGTASALKAYQEALKLAASGEQKATALALIADCQTRLRAAAKAAATLETLMAITDCRPEQKNMALLRLAQVHASNRKAIALCEQFLALPGLTESLRAEAMLTLADRCAKRNEYDRAIPLMEAALRVKGLPDRMRIDALTDLGGYRRELRQPQEAIAAFEQVIAMTSAPPAVVGLSHIEIGDTYLRPIVYAEKPTTSSVANAASSFERATTNMAVSFDRKAAAWTRLAHAQRTMGDIGESVNTLNRLLTYPALHGRARMEVENEIGDCLAAQKRYREALVLFQKTVDLNRHDMLKKIGWVARAGKDYVAAQHAYADLLPLTPLPENDEKGERKWVVRQLQILTKVTVKYLKPSIQGIDDKPKMPELDDLGL